MFIQIQRPDSPGSPRDSEDGAESLHGPEPVEGISTLIPTVILTSPTAEISKYPPVLLPHEVNSGFAKYRRHTSELGDYSQLRLEHGEGLEEYRQAYGRSPLVTPTSGPSGLGLPLTPRGLGIAADEMGVVSAQPHGIRDGDKGNLTMNQGPRWRHRYTSKLKAVLFRLGMNNDDGRSRRTSRFFSIGKKGTRAGFDIGPNSANMSDPEDTTRVNMNLQRLSFNSAKRWFGSTLHM